MKRSKRWWRKLNINEYKYGKKDIRKRKENKKMKRWKSLWKWDVVMPLREWVTPRWVVQSCQLKCRTLKIRPKNNKRLSSLNTLTEFLYFQNSMCQIHEARHSIYRKECLGKQDIRVGLSFNFIYLDACFSKVDDPFNATISWLQL